MDQYLDAYGRYAKPPFLWDCDEHAMVGFIKTAYNLDREDRWVFGNHAVQLYLLVFCAGSPPATR